MWQWWRWYAALELNSSDVNQWHGYILLEGLPPPFSFFLSADSARDTRDSIHSLSSYTSWTRATPSLRQYFSLCASVKWRRRSWGWRYCRCWSTTTRDHSHHHLHRRRGVRAYTQWWEFCRFDKVVSRTQSLACPRKFGVPIRKL